MLEYVLFHKVPHDLFIEFLLANNIAPQSSNEDGVFETRIREDIPDELVDKIEARYDELMAMNQQLFYEENQESSDNYRVASIMITLNSGETSPAHVNPDMLAKILEVITNEDLDEFVEAIVKAVENPDERCYRQKVKAGDINFE